MVIRCLPAGDRTWPIGFNDTLDFRVRIALPLPPSAEWWTLGATGSSPSITLIRQRVKKSLHQNSVGAGVNNGLVLPLPLVTHPPRSVFRPVCIIRYVQTILSKLWLSAETNRSGDAVNWQSKRVREMRRTNFTQRADPRWKSNTV